MKTMLSLRLLRLPVLLVSLAQVSVVPLALGLGLMPSLEALAQQWRMPLSYFSRNPDVSAQSRYAFILPDQATFSLPPGFVVELRFAAELDVLLHQNKLKVCYLSDRLDRRPSHTQCVEQIPARITSKTGPGQDTISIAFKQAPGPMRPVAVWAYLYNPAQPGLYPVELFVRNPSDVMSRSHVIGRWLVRVEESSFDDDSNSVE